MNPFDKSIREYQSCNFIDYNKNQSAAEHLNYSAAQLQREQFNSANIAEHFIHRKAGDTIGIKRTCGVSYVKQTESQQTNVSADYEPLSHLVIQGSYSLEKVKGKYYERIQTLMNQPLIVASIDSTNENDMKQYILNKNDRLKLTKKHYYLLEDGLQSLY